MKNKILDQEKKKDENILNEASIILKKYWNYTSFRKPQKDIILEVIKGNSVLALMPTGAGKSICYQIPAIINPGLSIVISPLIALIYDQVERLKNLGIKAASLSSFNSYKETDIILDNCIYGDIKLLYISPERINSQLFIERFKKMNVNLIAVDEAHCISQWGHDFRPSYLKINQLLKLKEKANVIALTASATSDVKKDILDKLEIKNYKEFITSFKRSNINYRVQKIANKNSELIRLLKNNNESIIVYTETRKNTNEVYQLLKYHNIKSQIYHAGLSYLERIQIQKKWQTEEIKIIVSTKAFGMGIDKPNVRYVIHMFPPYNLEEYYQESGRAGRDQISSYAILLYNDNDIREMKIKFEKNYPSIDYIKMIYNKLCNYFSLAYGSGEQSSFNFDLLDFINKYSLDYNKCYNALKNLEKEEILKFDFKNEKSQDKIKIKLHPNQLYNYRLKNKNFNEILEIILRVYGGEVFSEYCNISSFLISKKLNLDKENVKKILNQLQQRDILEYIPKSDYDIITFKKPRLKEKFLPLNKNQISKRKEIQNIKLNSIFNYLRNNKRCKVQIILEYFGEISYVKCNKCENCLKLFSTDINYENQIIDCINNELNNLNDIVININPKDKKGIISQLRKMLKYDKIKFKNHKFTISK